MTPDDLSILLVVPDGVCPANVERIRMALVHSEKKARRWKSSTASGVFFLGGGNSTYTYIYHEYTRYTSIVIGFYQTVSQ